MNNKTSKQPTQVEVRLKKLTTTYAYGSISINGQSVSYQIGLESKPRDNVFYEGEYRMILAASESAFLTEVVLKYMARAPKNMVSEMLKAGTVTDEGEMEIREFGRITAMKPTRLLEGLLRKLSIQKGDIIDV